MADSTPTNHPKKQSDEPLFTPLTGTPSEDTNSGENEDRDDRAVDLGAAFQDASDLVQDEDIHYEERYARILRGGVEPMFEHLPTKPAQLAKIWEACNESGGPLVLATNVHIDRFNAWMRKEYGLHKATRLSNGTVYLPEACAKDHGRLRSLFGGRRFLFVDDGAANSYCHGSGSTAGINPDGFWEHETNLHKVAAIEVGVSQSLPELRRRAYLFCSVNEWRNNGLNSVILVKRYGRRRLYIEVWQHLQGGAAEPAPAFNIGEPNIQVVPRCMAFLGNAHAAEPGVNPPHEYAWQAALGPVVTLPVGSIPGYNQTVPVDAQLFLSKCRWD